LRFLAVGGRLGDLSDSDISELNRLMGPERAKFRFPLLGIRMLGSGDLLEFKKEFSNWHSSFVDIALT
jgi:hypothetical protein